MNALIGQAGGLALLAVLAALFLRFLREMGFVKPEDEGRAFTASALFTLAVGAAYTSIGWFYYNFTAESQTAFFSLEVFWNRGPYAKVLELCRAFDLAACFQAGFAPLYPLLSNVFGGLLFGKTALIAGCISAVSAVFFVWNARTIAAKLWRSGQDSGRLALFLLLFLGMFVLFLPHPAALFLAFASGAFLAGLRQKKGAAVLLSILSLLSSFYGLAVLLAVVLWLFRIEGKRAGRAVLILCGAVFVGGTLFQLGFSVLSAGVILLTAAAVFVSVRAGLPRYLLYYLVFAALIPLLLPQLQGYGMDFLAVLFPAVLALGNEKLLQGPFMRRAVTLLLFPAINVLMILAILAR